MKKNLLIFLCSLLILEHGFAAAPVGLHVEQNGGELHLINSRTQTGFIERGGQNYWTATYMAEPGTYTVTGISPGCPTLTQSAFFEEGKPYRIVLTKDCRMRQVDL